MIPSSSLLTARLPLTAGPCRPRPREPAFQYSAYCVICASVLPRPPYEFCVSSGSSEEDAEYVDSVEIAECAVRRLPFLKPKSDAKDGKRAVWGVLGPTRGGWKGDRGGEKSGGAPLREGKSAAAGKR